MPYVARDSSGNIIAVGSWPENVSGPSEFVEDGNAEIVAFRGRNLERAKPVLADADPSDNSLAAMRTKFNELTAALRNQGIIE